MQEKVDICELKCGDVVILLKNKQTGDEYDKIGPMLVMDVRSYGHSFLCIRNKKFMIYHREDIDYLTLFKIGHEDTSFLNIAYDTLEKYN